jgi:hypothetical protein
MASTAKEVGSTPPPAETTPDKAFQPRRTNLGFLPIPSRLRYSPDHPFKFSLALNIVFAIVSTAAVTQLYISTPILSKLSLGFDIPYDQVYNSLFKPVVWVRTKREIYFVFRS